MGRNVPAVFISSTVEDLKAYRTAARDAALRAECLPKMQEYWAARDNPPLATCLARVAEADVLVVVVAHRFGWVPDDQPEKGRKVKSITWGELRPNARRWILSLGEDGGLPLNVSIR